MFSKQSSVPAPPELQLKDRFTLPSTWRIWRQKWNAFAAISGLSSQSDEYQSGMLISAMDADTLRVVNTLPYAAEEDRQKLEKILELLEAYCLKDETVMYERHTFYQRQQEDNEPVESFITDLLTLARTCDFTEGGKDFTEQ